MTSAAIFLMRRCQDESRTGILALKVVEMGGEPMAKRRRMIMMAKRICCCARMRHAQRDMGAACGE